MDTYRYQTASEVRQAIKRQWGADIPCRFSVKRVSFSDLARGSAFFVTLDWKARTGEFQPVLAPEFKRRIYQMFAEQFPKGSGVIVD
jgi:hypothetical protein